MTRYFPTRRLSYLRCGYMDDVHGGDMKGIGRIAASWAEQHGVQQVRFGLDRKLGDRAGCRRNEQMLSLKPRYVIAFQGNGVTERLVIDAKIGRASCRESGCQYV